MGKPTDRSWLNQVRFELCSRGMIPKFGLTYQPTSLQWHTYLREHDGQMGPGGATGCKGCCGCH